MTTTPKQNVCLIVIDGWGISPDADSEGDAIRNAKTPVMTRLTETFPSTSLAAHGLAVGLPEGLMWDHFHRFVFDYVHKSRGNSEVGHLNVGAGRVVYQDIVRIELAVKKKTLDKIPALVSCFERCKSSNGRLHLLGLVSDGGVHAHIKHLFALLETAKASGIKDVFIHFFGDGRDTSPRSTVGYLKELLAFIKQLGYGRLATITGRYYAMDRDKRWERVQIAYEGLTLGKGEKTDDPVKTVESRYAADETDEFLKPIIVDEEGCIRDDDTLLFFNFRSDRMRQICQTFGKIDGQFPFEVPVERKNLHITSMTQYKADFPFPVLFPQQVMDNVLGEWLSKKNVKQMHIAETEKYAHVTFFFNGGTEKQYEKEDRRLVASPKVATYDLKPEMSAIEVAQEVAAAISTKEYPLVMCNFAPPDMVGHTGKYEPAIKGVEATDAGIGIIFDECEKQGYTLFITADHGNAEKMLSDDKKTPHTAHTTARVPFIMTSRTKNLKKITPVGTGEGEGIENTGGALCDVAPTILEYMCIDIPAEMTGESLLV